MNIIRRLLIALFLFAPALAHAQSFPGNPNAGQFWVGQGSSAPPVWVTPAGDCAVNISGVVTCQSLQGVAPGALFSQGAGTGLSLSAGKLNISNTIAAGGPTGSATVAPIITYNAQGQLTAVSSATINQFGNVTADNVLGNFSGAPAAPGQGQLPSCSGGSSALTYNTGTHVWGCNSISASGVAGYGITIVSNVISAPLIAMVARPLYGGL
jgi:hypothetical protein